MPHLHARRPARAGRILARLVGEHQDPAHALGVQLARELRHRHGPRRILAAGHRDRGVVQDLEGHVGAGRDRLADREGSRVEQRPVAELLEEVRHVHEGREAHPLGAFAPHLGDPDDVPPHVHGEAVTADPAGRHRALGHDGRPVVGAPRAEVRRPRQGERERALARRLDDRHSRPDRVEGDPAIEAPGDHAGDHVGIELAVGGDQDLAALVALADDAGAVRKLVEHLAEEQLEEAPLLLDHQQLPEPARELADDPGLERKEHAELQDPDAVTLECRVVEAEIGQRLPEVVVGLARRRDPEPRVLRRHRDPVEPVGGGERPGRLQAPVDDLALDVERVGRQEPRRLARCPRAPLVGKPGIHDRDPIGMNLRGADRVRDVGHHLEGHPQPRVPRQLEPEAAEVEDVLDVSREEDRHVEVVERDLGVGGQGRRLGLRIVAREREHAAVPPDAREVRVAEDVPAPVHAGRLAVPHAEHAVVAGMPVEIGELASEHGGGAEILVHARDEDDLVLGHQLAVALHRLIEAAEGRSPVAGDQGRRVEAPAPVGAVLVQRQANERLDAGQEDAARLETVLRLEGEAAGGLGGLQGRRHDAAPSVASRRVARNAKGARRPLAVRPRPPGVPRVSGSRTRPGRSRTRRRSHRWRRRRTPVRS